MGYFVPSILLSSYHAFKSEVGDHARANAAEDREYVGGVNQKWVFDDGEDRGDQGQD